MKTDQLSEKNIVLGVTGSIAAYKSCDIVRFLMKSGAAVRVIMTRNAQKFIGPLTLETLSQNRVLSDMFLPHGQWIPEHIELASWARGLLIAPATANIIGKARAGIADDLLSSTILSVTCPVIFAPAMNERMYNNRIVQENIASLTERGYHFVGPASGFLADGYKGKGRLEEPAKIVEFVGGVLQNT